MVKKHGGSLEAHEVRERWMHRRSVTAHCPEPTMDRDDGNVQRECGTVAAHWPAPLGFHRPGCATIGSGLQPTQAWRSLPAARDAARAG